MSQTFPNEEDQINALEDTLVGIIASWWGTHWPRLTYWDKILHYISLHFITLHLITKATIKYLSNTDATKVLPFVSQFGKTQLISNLILGYTFFIRHLILFHGNDTYIKNYETKYRLGWNASKFHPHVPISSYKHDPFPTPLMEENIENVAKNKVYSFTDGFFGYH